MFRSYYNRRILFMRFTEGLSLLPPESADLLNPPCPRLNSVYIMWAWACRARKLIVGESRPLNRVGGSK